MPPLAKGAARGGILSGTCQSFVVDLLWLLLLYAAMPNPSSSTNEPVTGSCLIKSRHSFNTPDGYQ